MKRPLGLAVLIAAVMAAVLCLLSGCVSIGTPHGGATAVDEKGEAFVFGCIRMIVARNEHIEYTPFRVNPWDQPFFAPTPRMTLQLRQLQPAGGAVRYRTHPNPAIEGDGAFYWILPAGDYVLLGNQRLYGSKRFDQEDSVELARFSVPESGGTIYLGTLLIDIALDLPSMSRHWEEEEAEYDIQSLRVVDDLELDLPKLRVRFPSFPEPVVNAPMRVE